MSVAGDWLLDDGRYISSRIGAHTHRRRRSVILVQRRAVFSFICARRRRRQRRNDENRVALLMGARTGRRKNRANL